MKKISNIPLTILLVAFLSSILLVLPKLIMGFVFYQQSLWKYNADFETQEEAFCTVREYLAAQYGDSDGKLLSVGYSDARGNYLYDAEAKEILALPETVDAAFRKLCTDGFPDKDSGLYTIRIQGNRISFCIEKAAYALIYSPDGKPAWLYSPADDFSCKVKKAGNGWYHVVKDPG